MRIRISIFLLLFLSYAVQGQIHGKYYEISRITDGDTFVVQDENSNKFKIRLTGIDAPESRNVGKKIQTQVFGAEAKIHLQKYLYHKKVRLEFDIQKTDRFGRTLAYVYLADGTFLNDFLVRKGYARISTFPPNVKYAHVFQKSENRARKQNLGLWKYH